MISVQAVGCAPIVRAFDRRADVSEFWNDAKTVASGLRVPKALGDELVLSALYASRGEAVAASDEELLGACRELAVTEGIFAAPEGGAALVAVQKLVGQGKIDRRDRVVVFNTGSGYKYLEAWQTALDR
jgi:threonine synthase